MDPEIEAILEKYATPQVDEEVPTYQHKPASLLGDIFRSTGSVLAEPVQRGYEYGRGQLESGARAMVAEPPENATVLDRLRTLGGGLLGAAQVIGAPGAGVVKGAVELPMTLVERLRGIPLDQPRSPEVEMALGGAQFAGEVATPIGLGVSRLRALRAKAQAPPVEAPQAQRLLGAGTPEQKMFPEPRPIEAGPIGSTYTPPEPPIGKTQAIRDASGRVVRGPRAEPLERFRENVREPELPGPGPVQDVEQAGYEGLTLGQKLRWQIKAKRAAQEAGEAYVEREPSVRDYYPNGRPGDMSLNDWTKLHHTEELKKVQRAAQLSEDELAGTPSRIQEAVRSGGEDIDRPSWLTGAFKDWSEWAKTKLPMSMTHVAKNDPVFSRMVKMTLDARSSEFAMAEDWVMRLKKIAKSLGGEKPFQDMVHRIDRKLPLDPSQGQAATQFRELFDEMAKANSLDPSHPLYEAGYVPHLRNYIEIIKTRIRQSDDWVSQDVLKGFPTHSRPYYTKARKLTTPGEKYDLDTMIGHAKAAARGATWGTEIHHGLLKDLEPLLLKLDDRPQWKQEFIANWLNHAMGHPNYRGSEFAQKMGNTLRRGEFARTIVGSVTSPIYNSFQRILSTAEVSVKAAAQAVRDEARWLAGSEDVVKLVKEAKIPLESLGPGKLETEALGGGRVNKALTYVTDKGGAAFGFAERQNRIYTLLAGYHNARGMGKTHEEALQAGRDLIQKTQFTPGPADRPAMLRSEFGQTAGQFSYFKIKMMEYMWNQFADLTKRGAGGPLSPERRAAANKLLKFWALTGAIGGPATLPFVGDWLEKNADWKGIAPALGVAAKDQLGMGAVVPKDLQSFMFYVPGPFANHVRDAITAATGFDVFQPGEGEQNVASRVRAGTRSFPVAGVQLERIRRGLSVDTGGTERQPQTAGEGLGVFAGHPIPDERPIVQEDASALKQGLGLQDPEQQKGYERMTEVNRLAQIHNRAMSQAAQAKAIGDNAGVARILREAENDLGLPHGSLKISKQSIKAQREAARKTPLERRLKSAGQWIRNSSIGGTLE